MIRNQSILLIKKGCLQTTKARVKEVQRFIEKLVTIAKNGNDFNVVRRIMAKLPYDKSSVRSLIKDIAPRYKERNGGYTRMIPMGQRNSDTAKISRLEWV